MAAVRPMIVSGDIRPKTRKAFGYELAGLLRKTLGGSVQTGRGAKFFPLPLNANVLETWDNHHNKQKETHQKNTNID